MPRPSFSAPSARGAAKGAAVGTGGLTIALAAAAGLLVGEATLARRVIPRAMTPPPAVDGRYGAQRPGSPLRLAVLGDSAAAGWGVEQHEAFPAVLAGLVANGLDRPVDLRCRATVGAQTSDLITQVDALVADNGTDLAVVVVGANDITHLVLPEESGRHLARATARLRHAGIATVIGTCPDLGTVQPIKHPLRAIVRQWSRRLAVIQGRVAERLGAQAVPLGTLLGPEFAAAPTEMFGSDGFHPSATGYRAVAEALAPAVCAAARTLTDSAATR